MLLRLGALTSAFHYESAGLRLLASKSASLESRASGVHASTVSRRMGKLARRAASRRREPLLDARLSQRIRFPSLHPEPHITTLDLKDIKELISLMRKNDLAEFRLEQEGFKITLKRGVDFPALPAGSVPQLGYAPPAAHASPASAAAPSPAAEKEKLREITSPMVGTFYSAASPESAPFATSGKEVSDGTVVCIIEAMKVMNEIKSEIDGTIVEVVAENGKPVQFGQVLFRVR